MRYSIAQACLLSVLFVSATAAQCPKAHRNNCRVIAVQPCQTISSQPTCAIASSRPQCRRNTSVSSCAISQGHAVVQSQPVPMGCNIVQSYPTVPSVTSSIVHASPQFWPVASSPSASNIAFSSNATIVQSSGCNCSGNGGVSQPLPQGASQAVGSPDQKRNPFSLAGHAREVKPQDFCLREFLSCCESGGKDCMLNYYKCAEITGEQLRYNICPAEVPTIED